MSKFAKKILAIELITIAALGGIGLATCEHISAETTPQTDAHRFDGLDDVLLTTEDGSKITLPINENPISVVLNGFSEQEKEQVKNAINELDEILESVDYTICENDNATITQKIIINNNVDLDSMGLGYTSLSIDPETAQIVYPITIYVDPDCQKWHNDKGESALSYVIKHEMGHTLGLKDVEDMDKYGKTIMFRSLSDVDTYTEYDIKNLKQIYDEYYLGSSVDLQEAAQNQNDHGTAANIHAKEPEGYEPNL